MGCEAGAMCALRFGCLGNARWLFGDGGGSRLAGKRLMGDVATALPSVIEAANGYIGLVPETSLTVRITTRPA